MSVSRVPLSSIENKILPQATINGINKLYTTTQWPLSSTKFDELRSIIDLCVSDGAKAVRANTIIDQLQLQMDNQSPNKKEIQIPTDFKNREKQLHYSHVNERDNASIWHDQSPSGHIYCEERQSDNEVIVPELSQTPEISCVPEPKISIRRSNRRASISNLSILENLGKDSTVREKKPRPRTAKKTVEVEVREDMISNDPQRQRTYISPNKSPKRHETASPTHCFDYSPLRFSEVEGYETLPLIEEGEVCEPLCAISHSNSYSVSVDSPSSDPTFILGILNDMDDNKSPEIQSSSPFGLYSISALSISEEQESTTDLFKMSHSSGSNYNQNLDVVFPEGEGGKVNFDSNLDVSSPFNRSCSSSPVGSIARSKDSNDDIMAVDAASSTCSENPAFPSHRRGRQVKNVEISKLSSRRKSMRFVTRPNRFMMDENHLEMDLEIPVINVFSEGKAVSSDIIEGIRLT